MMQLAKIRFRWGMPLIVLAVILAQIVTHLAWLSISAHSGQVAIPWMMTQGRTLFGNLLEQHAPATSVISALMMQVLNIEPILVTRLLNLLVVLVLSVLVFSLARKLAGTLAALLALLAWAWWEPVYGNVLFYFDSLVGLLVMLALLAWTTLSERKTGWLAPLVAGLLLGTATLAKQHAWGVVVIFAFWLLISHRQRFLAFVAGALILPLAALLVVTLQGNSEAYLYWNWLFNFSGLMPNALPTGDLIRKLVLSNLFVPTFFLLALRRALTHEADSFWLVLAGVWLATTTDLLPRFSDDQAMAHLPLACVLGGIVLAKLMPGQMPSRFTMSQWWRRAQPAELALAGTAMIILIAWMWTGSVVYASAPLGRAGIPAYDEFKPLATELQALSHPEDTLFVLPETDSTPQIHPLSGLLPPGTWIKGWYWYFDSPDILNRLAREWVTTPPTYIVSFPDLIDVGKPGIQHLLDFAEAHYELVETVPDILFHGDALIYRYTG